jgi:hypothetical protein
MIKTDAMKEKDRGEAESVVNEDRKHAIEAAIVRTMKMRKVGELWLFHSERRTCLRRPCLQRMLCISLTSHSDGPQVMMHNQLVMEVINQLNALFKPDPRVIRKRIEDLIVREYLERDKDDMQKFRYLA